MMAPPNPRTKTKLMFAGIATSESQTEDIFQIGISLHDGTYSTDFWTVRESKKAICEGHGESKNLSDKVIKLLDDYSVKHNVKFLGAGITADLIKLSPEIAPQLWSQLDIVPLLFPDRIDLHASGQSVEAEVDEHADSAVRKCIMYFGPNHQVSIQIGFRNAVGVDVGSHATIATLEDYKRTVGDLTWESLIHYANEVKKRDLKIAFFSSTPQGGGVALMRHAIVRLLRLLEVNVNWYVPKPSPKVFKITKQNHDILQGVADEKTSTTKEEFDTVLHWAQRNAHRYWLYDGGPLSSPSKGGADFVIVDDPQMTALIPLAKKASSSRAVVFRSHIDIARHRAMKKGTNTEIVWSHLWNDVKNADVFIAHPSIKMVPENVPKGMLGFMPATTDWPDGLNKPLKERDLEYYLRTYNCQARDEGMTQLDYPSRPYIAQVARFDPSKGIPILLESYAIFARRLQKENSGSEAKIPQLLLAGHSSVDDPEATAVYKETLELVNSEYEDLKGDISMLRIPSSDQLLNTLLTRAKIVMQMSTHEGFEIKVSEALKKGIPVIASAAPGLSLQIRQDKNGYLVDVGDSTTAAERLHELWTDEKLYSRVAKYAKTSVSDEVGTVGGALSWLYLATTSKVEKGGAEAIVKDGEDKMVKPDGKWVFEMAREGAGKGFEDGESMLPRRKENEA